jgi:teichoic acid transport system permease protein
MSTIAERRAREDEFTSERHVYEPHRVGLPPLGPYVRELWRRRHFALELARTNLRSQHFNTMLGQLWLILNPLLLALVLFVLVTIVRGGSRGTEFLAHLMLSLFAYRLVSMSMKQGAGSVVGGGRLILFLPTLAIYVVVHAVAGLPVGAHLLWTLPVFALLLVFACGAAMLVAAVQVYFRDLTNFLTYFLRIWVYASPVLYYAHEVPDRYQALMAANPLYPMLGALSAVVDQGGSPSVGFLLGGAAWAVGAFVVGALFFVSREREFAVRL